MKKIIIKRLIWSLSVIVISIILLILFISIHNIAPYESLLPFVYIPVFTLLIIYQVVYNIFFFLSLGKNSEQIANSKAVREFFPAWQKTTVKISRIFIPMVFLVMSLWYGFSFTISSSYEKGIDKYLSPDNLLNYDLSETGTDTKIYSDFSSLYPMISYSRNGEYNYKEQKVQINAFVLESLSNRVIDSCYENSLNYSDDSAKAVYTLSENPYAIMNKVKTAIPFERDGLTGYYTVDKLMGANEVQELNSTEIAVKANDVYVNLNLSFSNEEDFSQLDIDKTISAVCDLANAVRSHSLYSAKTVLTDFYSEYGSAN